MKNKWQYIPCRCLIVLLILLLYAEYLVITAKAEIQSDGRGLDSRFRGNDTLPESTYTIHGVVKDEDNIPIGDAEISIFDGFSIRNIKSDVNGMYIISEPPVSPDLYAVLFFTKDGYIPGIINVKRSEQVKTDYSIVMKRGQKRNTGFVAGVIYQPIRGGKIKFQSGIYNLGKGRRVWLEKDGGVIEAQSNIEGHFVFEVPVGRYVLHAEGSREKPAVEITEGKTTIRNMRAGIILVD